MRRKTPEDVWEFVDVRGENECWPWSGYTTNPPDGNGYGYIMLSQRGYVAHRIIYALTFPGEIEFAAPKDKTSKQFVLHRCDNRLCCNPKHLFLGNYDDNNKDAKTKGRSRGRGIKGVANYAAKLTMEQARDIRWIASKGISNGEIAALYKISNEATRRVVNNVSYKE